MSSGRGSLSFLTPLLLHFSFLRTSAEESTLSILSIFIEHPSLNNIQKLLHVSNPFQICSCPRLKIKNKLYVMLDQKQPKVFNFLISHNPSMKFYPVLQDTERFMFFLSHTVECKQIQKQIHDNRFSFILAKSNNRT